MGHSMRSLVSPLLIAIALSPSGFGENPSPDATKLVVDLAHPGAAISPQMYGVFFEDINFAADGGLYPELVKNRSFEFSEPLTGWHEILALDKAGLHDSNGELAIRTERPLNASNPHYLQVQVHRGGG